MKSVLIVVFDGVQSLDVTGPLEVLHQARTCSIRTASLGGGPVRTSSGLCLLPDEDLRDTQPPDLLIVPGGKGARRRDPELTEWLRENAPAAAGGHGAGGRRVRTASWKVVATRVGR